MTDMNRAAFEAYFAASRKSKGAGKRPTFHRLPDGTYSDDHTQRHWWTWQNALAAQAPAAEPLTDEQLTEVLASHAGPTITPWQIARAVERAHGIGALAAASAARRSSMDRTAAS